MADLPPRFAPGLRLARRYLLEQQIGAGGMSEVWRAVDEVLGRPVAVKALAVPLASDPVLRSAMRREARAAARVAHPNVSQVFDYGEAAVAGRAVVPYLVMELLDGENLAGRLRAGPLAWPEAVGICSDVASALAAAHRLGVVHRDIKPGNVMLTPIGVKVVDFGISAVGLDPAAQPGPVAGTPAYAAPEVLDRAEPSAASDIYALGALLYETLTGEPPLSASSLTDAAAAHRRGIEIAPPAAPDLPGEVARFCLRCLSESPAQRPTSEQAAHDLAAMAGRPGTARAPTAGQRQGGTRMAVGVASAVVSHPGTANPTLLDPAARSLPAGTHADDDRYRGEAALVAPADRSGWLRWPPGPMAVALALATVTVLGLVLVVAALVVDAADRAGHVGVAAPPVASPDVTSPPVASPDTPAAVLAAITDLVARAQHDGVITEATAADLTRDLRGLRERLEGGPGKPLRKRVADIRERIKERTDDGKLDPGFAGQLDDLLVRLLTLTDRA